MNPQISLSRRVAAEGVGTCFLLIAVIGSGIMAERLAGGNMALALLANAIATGGALLALILTFGPISGAHLNPAVTLAVAATREMLWREVPAYVVAQVLGAFAGTAIAHLMFELPVYVASHRQRAGVAQFLGEFIATFGLLVVIWGCSRRDSALTAVAVAAYITGAYWFTSSTSFANPAVTAARAFSNTFAGIQPMDAPAFIGAQVLGAGMATAFFRWLGFWPARVDLSAPPQVGDIDERQ
jgi:glycerol uptake facilitator-like aquaporin